MPKDFSSNEYDSITNFQMPSEWVYRGEGNNSVVLALPKSRNILRIKKIERPKSLIGWLFIWISDFLYWYCGRGIEEQLRDIRFYSTIMRPLIGRKYTSEAYQVILSRKEINILEHQLSKHRPDFRRHKILQYGRACLLCDFAFIPPDEYEYLPFQFSKDTFAVEIKPKQGWQPLNEKHFPLCLFCMNQYLKLEKKQTKQISRYCPEDFFSGDSRRMVNAIDSLIKVPQNNFKVFKNGVLVYGENKQNDFNKIIQELFETTNENSNRLRMEFCDLIKNCLLTNLMNVDFSENCEEKLFCEWNKIIQKSNSNLPKGCILEKILSIQMLDSEGSSYYNKLMTKENFDDWQYIDRLLKKTGKNTCLKCTIMLLGNLDGEDVDLNFVPYLISAIAKDCSLMVTLKKVNEHISEDMEIKNIIRTPLGDFLVNIGVFDLYPKPLSTTKKHCKRNSDIIQAYKKATVKSNMDLM